VIVSIDRWNYLQETLETLEGIVAECDFGHDLRHLPSTLPSRSVGAVHPDSLSR
jgi:hypothetical protein